LAVRINIGENGKPRCRADEDPVIRSKLTEINMTRAGVN
jgi:hypothetical protein